MCCIGGAEKYINRFGWAGAHFLVYWSNDVDDIKRTVRRLVQEPLQYEGCDLVDVVVSRYRNNWTLRLFIYSERGTTINECARISRIAQDLIDGSALFESGYALEVSSPGLDRPLKSARDFQYRVGETVTIDFIDRRRTRSTAEIVSADDKEVRFKDGTGVFTVELSEIDKAKIVI